jgi:hypothetical protein
MPLNPLRPQLNASINVNSNLIHDQAIIDHFTAGIGHRVFILTPSYPFMFIGMIMDVVEDMVVVDVETTHFSQLEGRTWFIHVHNAEVFYIERDGEMRIPELKDLD